MVLALQRNQADFSRHMTGDITAAIQSMSEDKIGSCYMQMELLYLEGRREF
jgi:hypothetical protein